MSKRTHNSWRQREGWTCWGNDAHRFDALNRHPATGGAL